MITSFASYFKANKGLFLILFLWALSAIVANPLGEFPLNDDWVYLTNLKSLYANQQFSHSQWGGSTVLMQIIWGLLFCKIFGYSIFIIRISTLITSLLIGIFLYNLLKKLGGNNIIALLFTSVFIFNPILYVQSFTFMTESSFNLILIISCTAAINYLNKPDLKNLLIVTLVAGIAVLIKQPSLVVFAALPLITLFNGKNKLKMPGYSSLPLLFALIVFVLFKIWLNSIYGHRQDVSGANERLLDTIKYSYQSLFFPQINCTLIIIMYTGLFLLPIFPIATILLIKKFKKWNKKIAWPLAAIVTTLLTAYAWSNPIPCIENVLYNTGLGPILLHDTFILKKNMEILTISPLFWQALSIAGMLTGSCLFTLLISAFISTVRGKQSDISASARQNFQLLFCAGLFYIILLINVYIFDRYIVALASLTLAMTVIMTKDMLMEIKRHWYIIGFLLLAPVILFETAATHDYLEWNRAKWTALNRMKEDLHIPAGEIDGGYEYNGIHYYDVNYKRGEGRSWYRLQDDKYILTMGLLPGYKKFMEVPYSSWLHRKTLSILVLEEQIPTETEILKQ